MTSYTGRLSTCGVLLASICLCSCAGLDGTTTESGPGFSMWQMARPVPPCAAEEAATLIRASLSDEYIDLAIDASNVLGATGNYVSILKSYHHRGKFAAVVFMKTHDGWRMLALPTYGMSPGKSPTVVRGVVTDDEMVRLWDLLDEAQWRDWRPFESLRERQETSAAPLYFNIRRGDRQVFHCASYPENSAILSDIWSVAVRLMQGGKRDVESTY